MITNSPFEPKVLNAKSPRVKQRLEIGKKSNLQRLTLFIGLTIALLFFMSATQLDLIFNSADDGIFYVVLPE